jgi:hypothetical protein
MSKTIVGGFHDKVRWTKSVRKQRIAIWQCLKENPNLVRRSPLKCVLKIVPQWARFSYGLTARLFEWKQCSEHSWECLREAKPANVVLRKAMRVSMTVSASALGDAVPGFGAEVVSQFSHYQRFSLRPSGC